MRCVRVRGAPASQSCQSPVRNGTRPNTRTTTSTSARLLALPVRRSHAAGRKSAAPDANEVIDLTYSSPKPSPQASPRSAGATAAAAHQAARGTYKLEDEHEDEDAD